MGRFEELQKPWMQDMADHEAGKEVDYNHLRYRFAEAQAALDDFIDEEEEFGAFFAEKARDGVIKEAASEAHRLNDTFDSKMSAAKKSMQELLQYEREHATEQGNVEPNDRQHEKLLARVGKSVENFRIFRQKKVNSPEELSFENVWGEVVNALEAPESN